MNKRTTFLSAIAVVSASQAAHAGEYQEPAITPVYTVAIAPAVFRSVPRADGGMADYGSTDSGDVVDVRRFTWIPAYLGEEPSNHFFKQTVSYKFSFDATVTGPNARALASSSPDWITDSTFGIWKWNSNGAIGGFDLPRENVSITKSFGLPNGAHILTFDAHVSADSFVDVWAGAGANSSARARSGDNTAQTTEVTAQPFDPPSDDGG